MTKGSILEFRYIVITSSICLSTGKVVSYTYGGPIKYNILVAEQADKTMTLQETSALQLELR